MFLLKKWPHRPLLLAKLKSDSGSGSGFSQIFDSGSKRKTQNSAGVDSGNPDPVPPLVIIYWTAKMAMAVFWFLSRNTAEEIINFLLGSEQRLVQNRTGSDWSQLLAVQDWIVLQYFENWRIRTGAGSENICCFNVIILKIPKILVVIRFRRFAKW